MIEIVPDYYEDKEEFKAAVQLKQKLIDEYPDLKDSKDRKLKMIIEPRYNRINDEFRYQYIVNTILLVVI